MGRAEQTAFSFLDDELRASGTLPKLARQPARVRPLPPPPPRPELVALPTAEPCPEGDGDDEAEDGELEQLRQNLEKRIAAELPAGRLALAVTDNRYTMISVKREKGLYRLRLHHMFLEAEPEVVRALGRYVGQNDHAASTLLGRFIDINQDMIRRARRARRAEIALETAGEEHDLQSLYEDINRRYFDDKIGARITWGLRTPPGGKRKRRNSIKMGSYSVEDRLIRIHPSLDRPFVPRYFVEWIVFHEMLHQKHDIPVVGGRRQFHTPEFLVDEASFQHYDKARRWERENLNRLLVY